MTLIITSMIKRYTFQVSDRLVSVCRGGRCVDYETVANKSLVVSLRDSLFSIGYSGIAYLGGTTTDQWIAETITKAPRACRFGAATSWIHEGPLHAQLVVERLRTCLDVAFQARRGSGFGRRP